MPKRKKNDASAEKVIDKKKAPQIKAQRSEASTLSDVDSISKSKPSGNIKNDHRFHKVVGEKERATKLLFKRPNESRDDAVDRFRKTGWINDNTQYHESPNGREFHEGDSSKCPNCVRYVTKNTTGSSATKPTLSTRPLTSVEDVEKAWNAIPNGTIPYFEFTYYKDDLVLPLISMPVSVNRAMALFKKAAWFSEEKKELKARIVGKAESHECPGALQVKVTLASDMLKLIKKLDIRGWIPALLGAKDDFKEKSVTLRPRIEVAYTPQEVKLEVINSLLEPLGLKSDAFKPKEDTEDGRHSQKGNDTTAEAGK